jgi:dipeptidyl aminopeptidase/acylaminoacyl peptidase
MLQQTNRFMCVSITLLGLALLGAALVLTVGTSTAAETREIVKSSTLTFPGDEITVKALNTISTTSNFVLFSQPTGQEGTIWLLEEGITETAVITGYRPRLSPDGQSIIYLAGDSDPVRGDIYVYDLTTDTSTQIFSNWDSIVYYAWSTDSSRIFYDFRCKIYAMNPDGSNNEEIISDWIGSGIDYCYNDHPDVNPIDGRLVWENERYGLGIAASDGTNPDWIPNTQPGDFDPRWSPDGQWIAFFRDSDAEDDDNFFKIRPDGSGLTQLTFLAGDDIDEMEQLGGWSADGKFVVGAGEVGGVQGLYAVDANGTGLTIPLLKEAGADQYFVGNAGILDINIYSVYLPLTLR